MCFGLHGMVKWDSVCWECCHTKSRGSLFWSRVCLELQNFRSFWYGAKLSNHILQQEIVTIEYNWPKKIYDSAKLYDIPNISPQPGNFTWIYLPCPRPWHFATLSVKYTHAVYKDSLFWRREKGRRGEAQLWEQYSVSAVGHRALCRAGVDWHSTATFKACDKL